MSSPKYSSVAEYIETFPDDIKASLRKLRTAILEVLPNADEKISYNMPAFFVDDQFVIYFAAWKSHISLYPFTSEMEEKFEETKNYTTSGKGTIQFPLDKPLPVELIQKIVKFRLALNKENK
jgi:uncharacterized protein YdhG (YjbR/CyaY superfamily)